MGIKFDNVTPASATPIAAPASSGGLLDLTKGSILDVTKKNPGLTLCTLAAGWDAASAGANGIDLDLAAIMLNENDKITSGEDVVYFKHTTIPGVKLNNDNRTGAGDGDDETISINLAEVGKKYKSIIFVVTIFGAMEKRQTFGMVQNSYVRLLDDKKNKEEICRFRLKDECANSTAVIFAKLKRNGDDWAFETIADGKVVADLNGIAEMYL